MTTPQLVSAGAGVLLCLASLTVFFRRKTGRFKALFWFAIGSAMVYAAFRPHLIELLGEDSPELRLRLVVVLISFMVITLTLEAIRIGRMQECYAFLWLATGVLLLIGSLFHDLALLVTHLTGMPYNATVILILFSFVMLMLFTVSIALSRYHGKLSQLAREQALTEKRLRELEEQNDRKTCRPDGENEGDTKDDGTPNPVTRGTF